MPWETFKLNDGNEIPGIACGTGGFGNGRTAIDEIKQALLLGFTHIDTAQAYMDEEEAGQAIKESRVGRNNIFITTKYSHSHKIDSDIHTAIKSSLKFLDVSYVDLYLIHNPSAAVPNIPTAWTYFEGFQRKGWTKSIGVSNFGVPELKMLLASAKVKPAVNQIMLHPYNYHGQAPTIDFCKANGIVVEAFGSLTPLKWLAGGPLDKPLTEITKRRGAAPEQILLAWIKAKGVVAVTYADYFPDYTKSSYSSSARTSKSRQRLEGYLAAGDIELTHSEIVAIEVAGRQGAVDPAH